MSATTSAQDQFPEYCQAERLNSSRLSKMATSPLAFNLNPDLPPGEALRLGRLNHLCTLEHEEFLRTVVTWPGGMTQGKNPRLTFNKNSTAYKEFKAEQEAAGRQIIDRSELATFERIREGIMSHPTAGKLLTDSINEQSIYWTHPVYGVDCKCRVDARTKTAISDLKFLRSVLPRKVNRSIIDFNYHCQAAMYQDAVKALTGDVLPYYIIAAEKTSPFDCVVYEIDDAILDLGRQTYHGWIERYLECKESGEWPGISSAPVKAELPNWAYEQFEDDTIYIDGIAS